MTAALLFPSISSTTTTDSKLIESSKRVHSRPSETGKGRITFGRAIYGIIDDGENRMFKA